MTANSNSSTKSSRSPAELALEIYNLLEPYDSDTRQRVVQSAMTLLGEKDVSPIANIQPQQMSASQTAGGTVLGPKARRWMDKNGITDAMLDEVFHITTDGVDIIATEVPGAGKKEMTVGCYLLAGIRGLLRSDTPSIDDSEVIAICKRLTAYDKNNHTSYRQAVGNRMTGNKPTFVLTGPGEAAAAELIRRMTIAR